MSHLPTLDEVEESEEFSTPFRTPSTVSSGGGSGANLGSEREGLRGSSSSLSRQASVGIIQTPSLSGSVLRRPPGHDDGLSERSNSARSTTDDPLSGLRPPSHSDVRDTGSGGDEDVDVSGTGGGRTILKSLHNTDVGSNREAVNESAGAIAAAAAMNTEKKDPRDSGRTNRGNQYGRGSIGMPPDPPQPPRRRQSDAPAGSKPRHTGSLADRTSSVHRQGSNASTSSSPGSLGFSGSIRGSNNSANPPTRRISPRNPSNPAPTGSITAALMRRSAALSWIVHSTAHLNDEGQPMNQQQQNPASIYRGYKVNDPCLLGNLEWGQGQTGNGNYTSLVNRHGFPVGEGRTPEEQRGPYIYVFGIVKQINFEEFVAYYTVERIDTSQQVRGDATDMIPLHDEEAIAAARGAAERFANGEEFSGDDEGDETGGQRDLHNQDSKAKRCLEGVVVTILFPFFCLLDCFVDVIGFRLLRWGRLAYRALHREFHYLLNGSAPYNCTVQLTITNFLVMCSIWYMFIDQARLAFFPASSDFALAIVNFIVWIILVVELMMELFIRPEGYQSLIINERAFSPITVRYICAFHLMTELVGLGFFIPEFLCLFNGDKCDGRPLISLINASLLAVTGPSRANVLAGRLYFACVRFRVFGCVRHWKNMWVRRTFLDNLVLYRSNLDPESCPIPYTAIPDDPETTDAVNDVVKKSPDELSLEQRQREVSLINASNIGTALMVTNSYRSMTIFWAIISIFPMISIIYRQEVADLMPTELVQQLQSTNILVNDMVDDASCQFFAESLGAWVDSLDQRNRVLVTTASEDFLFSMAIQPSRCFEEVDSVLSVGGFKVFSSVCSEFQQVFDIRDPTGNCLILSPLGELTDSVLEDLEEATEAANIRLGAIQLHTNGPVSLPLRDEDGVEVVAPFSVSANFNQTYSIETSALAAFLLQICLLIAVISSLLLFRHDAENLVLGPLRNMLKIVARYAKNPLTPARQTEKAPASDDASHASSDSSDSAADAFGSYETEQLITAVSKITDLLRKCWGVAGADIISTNLASQEGTLEVFNPTVPGQSVYALFAFAAIDGFDHALKCLGGDVMILINDVAAVLHDEVFRWGFADSGQCNKNLGAAFLMVFRIGLVKEVEQKLKEATNVIFSTKSTRSSSKRPIGRKRSNLDKSSHHHRNSSGFDGKIHRLGIAKEKKRDAITEALSLKSLPGISTFTDLAVIGMLKSFAGIHRDKKLRDWSTDFRLSAGIGSFNVSMIFGMDAGWAVEGAVGSEYKIDATYLSPHVNMAARMMSACKHYGVTILLSEAVQELMSTSAQAKLRNLDRVTVKGSIRIQKIFTYDARHTGADFFLFCRSNEQADIEAGQYTPNIWSTDQDLKAMRHHVTEDFEQEFNLGLKAYLKGEWDTAIVNLEKANEIMVEAAMEEGYLHDELDDAPNRKELYRSLTADGPSVYLVNFMKSKGGVAPEGWDGWHPLLSK